MWQLPSKSQPLDLYRVHAGAPELRARCQHPRFAGWWPKFVESCRRELTEPSSLDESTPEQRFSSHLSLAGKAENVAFAAALTEDAELGRRAAALAAEVAADTAPWMSPGHHDHYPELNADLQLSERSKRLVAAYSWSRPWATEVQCETILGGLYEHGGGVIFNDAEEGAWWADGYNSNWTAVLNSGLALNALAIAELDPEAGQAWLDRAVRVARRMLDLAKDEGAGIEGMGYWVYCFRSLLDLCEAVAGSGDSSLYDAPCWQLAASFAVQLCLPDQSSWLNFGDCGKYGIGGSHLFYALSSRCGDPLGQWLGNRVTGDPPNAKVGLWDLLFCDPDLPEQGPSQLPTSRGFQSVQLGCCRSDWSPEAVQFVLKGGSNAWSHCHLDLASFVLNAGGDPLAVDPGPWPYTPDYWTSVEPPQSTAWHNTITVDGADQRQPPRYRMSYDLEEAGDCYARLTRFEDRGAFVHQTMDATTAYADQLARFHRHACYLPPNTVLIVDDIQLHEVRCQRHLQWLLHATHPIELTESGMIVRGEQHELHVTALRPHAWRAKLLPDRLSPKDGQPPVHCWALRTPWHHIWNVSPSRSPYPQWDPRAEGLLFGRDRTFAVLLEVTPKDGLPSWSASEPGEDDHAPLTLSDGVRTLELAWDSATGPVLSEHR